MKEKKILIRLENLQRHYHSDGIVVKAVNGINFKIKEGEFVGIIGASGSGKTTMLRILGLIDQPTKGDYFIQGLNVKDLPEAERSYYRLTKLGYVFQDYALVNEMSALENIYALSIMEGNSKEEAIKTAQEALKKVGLEDKGERVPNELSGGEKQRVAVARAIAKNPQILFADEPCANLDTKSSEQVLDVFRELNQKYGLTIMMVTHEPWHLKYVSRVIELKDGYIIRDRKK